MKNKAGDMERILKEKDKHGITKFCRSAVCLFLRILVGSLFVFAWFIFILHYSFSYIYTSYEDTPVLVILKVFCVKLSAISNGAKKCSRMMVSAS